MDENMDVGAPDNTPLISVIVPIYNVAPWLRKCLDSLKGQTLKQIEVIMVEDGSTDESGEIAEEYVTYASDEWPVFRVIHHGVNRGLSAARNTGIDAARAEYLMFVDSDDWVDEKFCEIPYKAVVENDVDAVLFRHYEIKRGTCKEINKNARTGLITHEMAIDTGGIAVWRKLFKKSLFEEIRFPEGKAYEDVAVTHRLIYQSHRIFSCNECLYYHRVRINSITQLTINDNDLLELSIQRTEELISLGYPEKKAKVFLINCALRCLGCSENKDSQLYKKAEEVLRRSDMNVIKMTGKTKLKFMLWHMNRSLFRVVYQASRRRVLISSYKEHKYSGARLSDGRNQRMD